jgi:hypothetical protein
MELRGYALVVFGVDTSAPTIVALHEATIARITDHGWVVLARDNDVLECPEGPRRSVVDDDRTCDR